jgi:hypothetical protein
MTTFDGLKSLSLQDQKTSIALAKISSLPTAAVKILANSLESGASLVDLCFVGDGGFIVKDNGTGISPNSLPCLGEFRRNHQKSPRILHLPLRHSSI